MSNHESEQDRLKRLRDNQIASRDPHIKQSKYNRAYSVRAKRKQSETLNLKEMWSEIPHVIRSPFFGFVLGLLVLWLLPKYWISQYAVPVSIGCIVLFIVVGLLIGNSLDLRDNLRDLSK